MCNAVGTKIPNFVDLGIPAVHTSDKLMSFSIPDTRVGSSTDGSKWSVPGRVFGKATSVEERGTRLEKNYSSKTNFETRR